MPAPRISLGVAILTLAYSALPAGARTARRHSHAATRHPRTTRAPRKPAPYQPPFKSGAEAEALTLERINRIRSAAGLQPLRVNERLAEVARAYSRQMAEERFFEHTSPSGSTLQTRVNGAGLRWTRLGENIYKSYNLPDPVSGALKGWINSPGHKHNILNPNFTETGIGVWVKDREVYFTQDFIRPGN